MPKSTDRSKRGILVSVAKIKDGEVVVTVDDIKKNSSVENHWAIDTFLTSKDYDEKVFDELNFDEKELADFGYFILSRLHAFKKCGDL